MNDNERRDLDEAMQRHRDEVDKLLALPPEQWLTGLNQENDRHYHQMTRLLFRLRQVRESKS